MSLNEGMEVLVMLGMGCLGIFVGALVLYVKWAIWDRM